MMASFSEDCVDVGTETQGSLAQEPMLMGFGSGGEDGASDVHAQSETVTVTTEHQVLDNQANLNVVMDDQNIENGASGEYAVVSGSTTVPVVYQTEGGVSDTVEVVNESDVGSGKDASEVQVAVSETVTNVLSSSVTSPPPPVVMDDQNNNKVVTPSVVICNEVVTPVVVGNENNSHGSHEVVVTPGVVSNENNSSQVVTPGVLSNENNSNSSNEVVNPSVVSNPNSNNIDQVVIPSVVDNQANSIGSNNSGGVNYQNNDIGNNVVATNSGVGEAIKRKRGRPRKYPITEALTVPVSSQSVAMQYGGPVMVNPEVQGTSKKRGRGRPAGSGKKHKADEPLTFAVSPGITGSTGAGFMPYIITVKGGEYVMPKLLSLSQVDKQVVCVLSASGSISNVTLQQPSSSGGTVTYQGHFEILSLSGSFLLSESGGRRSRTGGLSVSLAVPNGGTFGGGVAGPLIADSDVQIIVGTFMASEQNLTRQSCNELLSAPPNQVSSVGESPPFRALLSETSRAPVSPLNHSNGGYNNGNQQPFPNVAWM